MRTTRRAATVLATLGALVMSSGVALMVTATPAGAENCENSNEPCYWENAAGEECQYFGPQEAGGFLVPAEPAGRDWSQLILKKGDENSPHVDATHPVNQQFAPVAGQTYFWDSAKGANEDGWGYSHAILCSVPEDEQQQILANATATPNTPTCEHNVPSYTKGGANIEDAWAESAPPAFNTTITVTATAVAGAEFDEGGTTKDIDVTFPAAATGCDRIVVEPPLDDPLVEVDPKVEVAPPAVDTVVTPTVVNSGLTGANPDLRGEQGLALVLAGLVLLVCAGGLGVARPRRSAQR